jgi:ferritin-like metal-binding protein YciE
MFERLNTPDEAFHWQLGAALTMEQEIVGMLDDLIGEASDEGIKEAFRSHQTETRGHIENIERAFRALGWESDDSPCPAIKAIDKEGKANLKKANDSLKDSIIVEGAIETEHHEIAVYEYLIIQARAMGRDDVVEPLERNLEQEREALQKVSGFAERLASASFSHVAA